MTTDRPSRTGPAVALLAVLAYLPALLTARGQVAADTKQYLMLDPGRLLAAAPHLWDPSLAAGHVTHQTIGYLWPMGPFFWLFDTVGLPDWVAQRLWIGTIVFLAATGMLVCARVLRLAPSAALAAALSYGLSPYLLGYVNRTSVLLSPWAGLGWLLALTILAARKGGWRYPALAALTITTIGGINATALVLCGLAPVLWLVHTAAFSRQLPAAECAKAGARIGSLAVGANLWWIVALAVQSRYGADVLTYTETVEAVSTTSLAGEVLRGLGYWLFYGGDVLGPWNSASTPYLQSPGLLGLGFALVVAGMVAVVTLRWVDRAFLALLVLVGTVVAVGAHRYADPSPLGAVVKGASAESTLVLALRSSTRAVPLVLLALALAVGAALTAMTSHRRQVVAATVVGALAVVNLPALWNGTLVDDLLRRPEDLPTWWDEAAAALDRRSPGTRVLELPGQEFAAYRWGQTNDPILPGLADRPLVTRDLQPLGGAAVMDLVNALDQRFQDGVEEPAAIAPVARLLGVGDVVHRGDVWFERYRTPRPEQTWATYRSGITGLGPASTFGRALANEPDVPVVDEDALTDLAIGNPVPPVAVLPVEGALPTVRARPADRTVLVAGSGDGLVDAAAAGVLDGNETVLYSASFPDELPAAARLVVTDSNRKRATQWRGTQDVHGDTETVDGAALVRDSADSRLPVFPGADTDTQTVAVQRGAEVRASRYGSPTAYWPEDRAVRAVDGDLATAWRVADRADAEGERLRIDLPDAVDPGALGLVQDLRVANRWITEVVVRTEQGDVRAALTDASRQPAGQGITLPPGPTSWVEIEIAQTNIRGLADWMGVDAVGIAEVSFAGLAVDEVIRPPVDLLARLGPASLERPLDVVLTRHRVDPSKRWRDDPEPSLVRLVTNPVGRGFAVGGTARLSARADDATLAGLVEPDAPVRAIANARLAGSPTSWGRSAVDGDETTLWRSPFDPVEGTSITVAVGALGTFDRLDLVVAADGRASVPTALAVEAGGVRREVSLPAVADGPEGTLARLPVVFEPVAGDTVTVTVTAFRPVFTIDRRSAEAVALPLAVAELGLGVTTGPLPPTVDTGCRPLLSVDGAPVNVRLQGPTAQVLAGAPMALEPCEAGGLLLPAGEVVLRSVPGRATGLDVDRVVLRSVAGGGPGSPPPPSTPASVAVTDVDDDRTTVSATIPAASGPFWLVLGQSDNRGWSAEVDGKDLGAPSVVDGGSNGWLVDPAGATGPLRVQFRWTPQRFVWFGLLASAVGVLVCLVLVVAGRSKEREGAEPDGPTLASPWRSQPVGSWTGTVIGALVSGAVAALTIVPAAAAVVAPLVALSLRWRHGRAVLATVGLGAIVAVAVAYVGRQIVTEPAEGFGWVTRFEPTHRIALLAVVLVAADALAEVVRDRTQPPAPEEDAPPWPSA